MPVFRDHLGRVINLSGIPQRIISLVPSQTELLYDLHLGEKVVGITKFCIYPDEWFRTKRKVGGTKNVNLATVKELDPHLIIANKEENVKAQIEALSHLYPVWISDINNLEQALQMIGEIGSLTATEDKAGILVNKVQAQFNHYNAQAGTLLKAVYLIWKNPYMTVGGDTFIHDMLQKGGFQNNFAHHKRYPQITLEDLQTNSCDVIFLSTEPYPFIQKDIDELQLLIPHTKILLVDGEAFSWYGSRLEHSPQYFAHLRKQIAAQ